MTLKEIRDYKEKFHAIRGKSNAEVGNIVYRSIHENNTEILKELNFNLASEYYNDMSDLMFELLTKLEKENTENDDMLFVVPDWIDED